MINSEEKNNLNQIFLKQEWIDFVKDVEDFFNKNYEDYKFNPEKVLRSIFYNLENKDLQDTDRVQTIASKIRAFLYPIFSKEISKKGSSEWVRILNIAQSIGTKYFSEDEKSLLLSRIEEIKNLYSRISDLDHYCIDPQFEEFKNDKNRCLNYSLEQIRTDLEELKNLFPTIKKVTLILHEIAKSFDNKMKKGSLSKKKDLPDLIFLMNLKQFNFKDFFYGLIDEKWIDWLFENGFFEVLKQKAEDTSSYRYKTPELNYLAKVTEKVPEKVTKVILSTPISEDNFNPEVIDRFIFITSQLKASETKKIVKKMYKERWLYLMRNFSLFSVNFENIIKKIFEIRDYQSVIILAKCLFEVNDNYKGNNLEDLRTKPFYFNNFKGTEFFEYLLKIEDQEAIYELVEFFIKEVIGKLIDKKNKDSNYIYDRDKIPTFQINIFETSLRRSNYFYPYSIMENIFHIIATLSTKLEFQQVKKLFNLIKEMNITFNTYRIKLYLLSLYKKEFKREIKEEIFAIFKSKDFWSSIGIPEYQFFIKMNFDILSNEEKNLFIEKIIDLYKKEKEIETKKEILDIHKISLQQVLSVLKNYFSENQYQKFIKNLNIKIFDNYKPKPLIGPVTYGRVADIPLVDQKTLDGLTIPQIVEKLKTEWSPLALEDFNKKQDDFFKRYTPDGLFLEIKINIEKRFQEYIDNAYLFFDKEKLHPHYTYKFLHLIESILKEEKINFLQVNFDNLFQLFENIKNEGFLQEVKQEIGFYTGWVISWRGVYTALSDLLRQLLTKGSNGKLKIDFKKYRQKILEIIKFLLQSKCPTVEEDKESKRPFDLAINTTRGRSFELFVYFIIADGEKLASDVKEIYQDFIEKEKTMGIYWLFGRHLAYFHYRDRAFVKKIVKEKILKNKNKDLYFAFWEGVLSTNLYEEIFYEFQDDYGNLIKKSPDEYTKRDYLVNLDEGIGIHLCLAFVYYDLFNNKSNLFKDFWNKEIKNAHFHFINTVGVHIFEKKENIDFIKDRGIDIKKLKEKIKNFCEFLINKHQDRKDLKAFSSWINLEVHFFEKGYYLNLIEEVLKITGGDLDMDYQLEENLDKIVDLDKKKTFNIVKLFYLNKAKEASKGKYVHIDEKVVEIFKILYENKETKEDTEKLINDLIEEAGEFGYLFWKLEEILN